MLVDFVDFLVNVFTRETRQFYQLERVWRDAPVLVGERPDLAVEDGGVGPASDPDAEDALEAPIFREDLTVDEVQACRAAFEPPFLCDGP